MSIEEMIEGARERKMRRTIEDTDYIFGTYSQAMENLEEANKEDNDVCRGRCYMKSISLFEALPGSAFERGDIRRTIGDLYKNAFNFFVNKEEHVSGMSSSFDSEPSAFSLTCYYSSVAMNAKVAIEIAERARKKLELILCDEATLQGLREKVEEAEKASENNMRKYKAEDDHLFYSNYGEWKRQQK